MTVEIECPICEEPIASPSGSHFWEMNEVPQRADGVDCPFCKNNFRLPVLGFMRAK